MNKHLSNKELKNFADGNYPVSELFDISKHITQCLICRNNLKDISPAFFTELGEKSSEPSNAKNEQHFSDDEILGFLKGESSLKYRLKMSEHFRSCLDCKTKVFQKDPDILVQTITTYLKKNENPEEKTFFSTINAFIPIGVMGVLLAATLSYGLLVGVKFDMPDALLTKAIDISETSSIDSEIPVNENIKSLYSDSNTTKSLKNTERNNSLYRGEKDKDLIKTDKSFPKSGKDLTPKTETNPKINKQNNLSNSNKIIFATRRSTNKTPECASENDLIIGVEPFIEKVDKQPTFRWKPVSGAVKYNFYLSDSAQVLIEGAEVEKETFYMLKTPLEQNKSYKWIVIATMPNGDTVSSLPIYFSAGKTPQKNRLKANCNNK